MYLSRSEKVPEKTKQNKTKPYGVMGFHALKLCSTSKYLLKNVQSWILDVKDTWLLKKKKKSKNMGISCSKDIILKKSHLHVIQFSKKVLYNHW